MINGPLQLIWCQALDLHPSELHQSSSLLDAVGLWTVGRQELELDALPFHKSECALDGSSLMDRGVVDHKHKRFIDLAVHIPRKAKKGLGGSGLLAVDVYDRAAAEQRGGDIGLLATCSSNEVLLAAQRPGAVIGINLNETRLVEVGQSDPATQRLCPQPFKRLAGIGEGGGISFFYLQWRGRLHTRPMALRVLMRMFASTVTPLPSAWRYSSAVDDEGFSRGHCPRRSMAAVSSLDSAQQRGLLLGASMPRVTQRCRFMRTVSVLRSYSLASSRRSRGCYGNSKILARPRTSIGRLANDLFQCQPVFFAQQGVEAHPNCSFYDMAHVAGVRIRTHAAPETGL